MENKTQYRKHVMIELNKLNRSIDALIIKGKCYKHLQAKHKHFVALLNESIYA